jgi:hypothetical protein
MKLSHSIVTAALAAAFALGINASAIAATAAHDHAHDAGAPAQLVLDHGKKWTTDAPLRKRMGEIRSLLAQRIPAIHAGKLSAAEYRKLGAAVEEKVGAIVAECKLPPEADAMLHVIVADLVAGAEIMQGKAAGKPADGAHKVATAANAYGEYFDDKGWKPLG